MLKKSLMFFSVVFIIGVFILGCSNPTAGPAGEKGDAGPGSPDSSGTGGGGGGDDSKSYPPISSAIDAATLAGIYAKYDKVVLFDPAGTTPIDVDGVIPTGKTLTIQSPAAVEAAGLTLNGGTLIIEEGGELTTNGISSSGTLTLTSGKVQVDGFVAAPLAFFSATLPAAVTVEYGDNAGALLEASVAAADVNTLFADVKTIKWATTGFNAAAVTALVDWTGDEKLILTGANTLSAGLDVLNKGKLEIEGTLSLGASTLTASASGNVTVSEAGTIALNDTTSALVGAITVKGTLSVGAALTTEIPASVDLTAGTVTSSNASAKITLPASTTIGTVDLAEALEIVGATTITNLSISAAKTLTLPAGTVTVGTIDVAEAGTIAGATGLAVTTITNSAAKTLTLPAGTVTVTNITTDASGALAIAGTTSTTLSPVGTGAIAVSGAAGLT